MTNEMVIKLDNLIKAKLLRKAKTQLADLVWWWPFQVPKVWEKIEEDKKQAARYSQN